MRATAGASRASHAIDHGGEPVQCNATGNQHVGFERGDQQQHHLRGFGRSVGGAYAGHQPGLEPTRTDRHCVIANGQFAAGAGPGLERQPGREYFFRGHAARHRIFGEYRCRHRRRHRESERRGRTDGERLRAVLRRRHPETDQYQRWHQRDTGGRGHHRQSLHGRGHIHRSVGRSCKRRSIPDSTHGRGGGDFQRRADQPFASIAAAGCHQDLAAAGAPTPRVRPPSAPARCSIQPIRIY